MTATCVSLPASTPPSAANPPMADYLKAPTDHADGDHEAVSDAELMYGHALTSRLHLDAVHGTTTAEDFAAA